MKPSTGRRDEQLCRGKTIEEVRRLVRVEELNAARLILNQNQVWESQLENSFDLQGLEPLHSTVQVKKVVSK